MVDRGLPGWTDSGYGKAFACAVVLHAGVVALVLAFSQPSARWGATASRAFSAKLANEPAARAAQPGAVRAAQAKKESIASSQEQYIGASTREILRHWTGPRAGIAEGMSCELLVKVLATGTVTGVQVVRSSGSVEFDRSVVEAIWAASPLPAPPAEALRDNVYELDLIFDPTA